MAVLCWSILLFPAPLRAEEQGAPPLDASAPEAALTPLPFDEQPYSVQAIVSFSDHTRFTPRLRGDVLRRFRTHAAAFIGRVWQLEVQDASDRLQFDQPETMQKLTAQQVAPFSEGRDKLFVLGVRFAGDRFLLAGREYDVAFDQWGPEFHGTARETGQIARELMLIASRMFSPLAQIESAEKSKVTIRIKGGRLPTLDQGAVDPKARHKPGFQFVQNGTLLRPMRYLLTEEGEVAEIAPLPWTLYEVDRRDGPLATCRVHSAIRNPHPAASRDRNEPQLIVLRSAGGSTVLRIIDSDTKTPLAAMDVEVRERIDAPYIPLGTTDLDGRISIPPNRTGPGHVTVFVRHGRDTMAMLPILPGAAEEPELALKPDAIRLDIEGRVVAVQEQIIDQVARRKILQSRIKSAIAKKNWNEGEALLKFLKESPTQESMLSRLEHAKVEARAKREEKLWTGKVKRMFSETEQIIQAFFNPDEFADLVEGLEDELVSEREAAAAAAGEALPEKPPAASGAAPGANDPLRTSS
jgi:hypothetical protein